MRLQLQMSIQPMRLDLSSQRPVLNLQSQPAQMEMESDNGRFDIQQSRGRLTIDSYESRAALGIKSLPDMIGDFAQQGLQTSQEVTAMVARDGDRLARIAQGGATIIQIGVERSTPGTAEVTIAPKPMPIMSYEAGLVEIDRIRGTLNVTVRQGGVTGELTRGTVDIRVAQYPSINFWTVEAGNSVDVRS